MEFSPRARQILLLLLKTEQPVHEQEIADTLGVSKRTIQREFEVLEGDLAKRKLTLDRVKGAGATLVGSPEGRQELLEELLGSQDSEWSDKEERRRHLLFELLRDRTPRKLFYYSQLLGVSEATVGSDMEALGAWLLKNNLTILKKPGYGVVLNGAESDYREAMRRFINENADGAEERLRGNDAVAGAVMNMADSGVYNLLNTDTINRVYKALNGLKEPRLKQLTENDYIGLVMHIAIGIERIREGGIMEENAELSESLESWEEYDLAVRILNAIESEFSIKIPDVELSYILLHIRGSKIQYSGSADTTLLDDIDAGDMVDLIDRMIDAYDPAYAYDLKRDEEFIRGLMVHLAPTFVRLKNHLNIFNPLLSDIKSEYADIYRKCAEAAKVITQKTGLAVNEEEIGYLTMHFGAATEKINEKQTYSRKVTIGIICASGFGVARLMMTKLYNKLGRDVKLKPYGMDEITQYVASNTDFFVTSLNLERLGVDYVQVSPLITTGDLEQIRCKIEEYSRIRKTTVESDFAKQLDMTNFIIKEISTLIQKYRHYEVDTNISFDELLIFLAGKVTEGPRGAGVVKESVTRREALNSQVFPDMGFALLHCKTKAVREVVFCTCSPAGGESFQDPYFKGIKAAILMLAPIDEQSALHSDILGYISGAFVNNREFTEAILRGEEENARTELRKTLKSYFNEFLSQL